MKKMIYLMLLMITPVTLIKADDFHGLEGVYSNANTYQTIQVETGRKYIQVRGLSTRNPRQWVQFRRINKVTYIDNRGNELRIRGKSKFQPTLLIRDNRGRVEVYNKGVINPHSHTTCTTTYGYDRWDDDWSDYYNDDRYNDHYDSRYNDDRYYNNRPYNNNNRYNDQNNYGSSDSYSQGRGNDKKSNLQGTYRTNDGKTIALLETRDGFKAKFSGDRSWKNYTFSNGIFTDSDGNSYTVISSNQLEWRGKYSGKTLLITKVDDDVKY